MARMALDSVGALSSLLVVAFGPAVVASSWEVRGTALRDDPRVEELVACVAEARGEALRRLSSDFRLVAGELPIRWVLSSVNSAHRGEAAEESAFEAGRTVFESGAVCVRLPAHRYLERPRKARRVVLHEATHAVLASRLGRERYFAIPKWFREGLALWVAGEGDERVRAYVARRVLEEAPVTARAKRLPGGFRPGGRSGPAEAYLALDSLRRALGDARMVELVQRVAGGDDFDRVVADAGLQSAPQLHGRLRLEIKARLRRLVLAPEAERLREALSFLARGETPRARSGLETLLDTAEARSVHSTVRYYLALCLLREDQPERAATHLEELLGGEFESLWEPEALWLLGRCLEEQEKVAQARRLWREVLERFPDDTDLVARARASLQASLNS